MKVLHLFPPNYPAINRAFNVRGKPILFAYGAIYNPSRIKIPDHLMAHEAVHIARQGDDPAAWWERYIGDRQFRLDEEIAAHQAECRHSPHLAEDIAQRLASPLYGSLIGLAEARQLLGA